MPFGGAQARKLVRRDRVARLLVLQVGLPVDVDRVGDVPGRVEQEVLVRLDDADRRRVGEVVRDPTVWRRGRREWRSRAWDLEAVIERPSYAANAPVFARPSLQRRAGVHKSPARPAQRRWKKRGPL